MTVTVNSMAPWPHRTHTPNITIRLVKAYLTRYTVGQSHPWLTAIASGHHIR